MLPNISISRCGIDSGFFPLDWKMSWEQFWQIISCIARLNKIVLSFYTSIESLAWESIIALVDEMMLLAAKCWCTSCTVRESERCEFLIMKRAVSYACATSYIESSLNLHYGICCGNEGRALKRSMYNEMFPQLNCSRWVQYLFRKMRTAPRTRNFPSQSRAQYSRRAMIKSV